MVEVKVGQVYECPDLKTGQGQKGEWGMFRVKAKKGYDNIVVWASNAGSIAGATAVKVVEIQNVKMSSHEKDGKWYKDYSVTAKLERAESGRQGAGSANKGDGFLDANLDDAPPFFF